MATYEAMWFETAMKELNLKMVKPMRLLIDNRLAIDLAKYPVAHGRSKHIKTKFHFLRDQVSKENLELEFCKSEDQLANMMTKPLKYIKFKEMIDRLGIMSSTNMN